MVEIRSGMQVMMVLVLASKYPEYGTEESTYTLKPSVWNAEITLLSAFGAACVMLISCLPCAAEEDAADVEVTDADVVVSGVVVVLTVVVTVVVTTFTLDFLVYFSVLAVETVVTFVTFFVLLVVVVVEVFLVVGSFLE